MIIDPEINNLNPEMSIAGLSTSDRTTKPDDGSPDDPPPPYTVIDFQVIAECQEELGTVTPSHQFCRCESMTNRIMDRSWSFNNITPETTATSPGTSGLREIQDGGRQIVDSTMFFAETSLIAAGGVVEGFGKIISGLGRSLASRRAYLTRKNL